MYEMCYASDYASRYCLQTNILSEESPAIPPPQKLTYKIENKCAWWLLDVLGGYWLFSWHDQVFNPVLCDVFKTTDCHYK